VTGWTPERALAAVQAFARERGYQPVSREAGRHGLPTYDAAARLFGSWNALIAAAGFRPYPARSSAQAKTLAHRDRQRAAAA
jgi:Homing endonuclease associated repeat